MTVQPLVCLSNVAVFDPDIVYIYTSPFIEVDHLCYTKGSDPGILKNLAKNIPKGRYIVLEEVSQLREVVRKHVKRALLSIAYPPTTLWLRKDLEGLSVKSVRIKPWLYLAISELLNASLYSILLLPDDTAKEVVDSVHQIVKSLGLLNSETTEEDPLLKLVSIIESLSDKQSILKPYLEEKLEKLKSVCNSNAWIALIQSGVGKYRLGRIRESVDILKDICRCFNPNIAGLRVIYVISEVVEESFAKEGIKSDDVMKLLNAQKRIAVKSCNDVEIRGASTFIHSLSRGIDYGDYVKKILRELNSVTVIVFGDFSKSPLVEIIDKNLDELGDGRLRLMAVNEAFYVPTTGAEYSVTTYFGYLKTIEAVANKIKENEEACRMVEQLQIEKLLGYLKSMLQMQQRPFHDIYGALLLLLLKTVIA